MQVAILIVTDDYQYLYAEDEHVRTTVVSSITEWTEVTKEEYNILVRNSRTSGYQVLARPEDEKAFVKQTVSDHLEAAKKKEAAQAEAKRKRDEKAKKDAEKKRKAAEKKEIELLKQLKEKYEKDNAPQA